VADSTVMNQLIAREVVARLFDDVVLLSWLLDSSWLRVRMWRIWVEEMARNRMLL